MSDSLPRNSMVGQYRLIDFIGEGGMGVVYRAIDEKLNRVAAVKVLNATAQRDQAFVERFYNEARIHKSLRHQNIAKFYEFNEFQGQPCIIMEYVDGDTLCDRVRPVSEFSTADVLSIFSEVVKAIAYMHDNGIIHRDIKSNNIKISSHGNVKLLDFGIAKGNASPSLTQTGSVVGTMEYLSPEQLSVGYADERSDIWALGVLLYEMMTGHVPFEAQTIGSLCAKISNAEYPPLSQVNPRAPQDVANIVARCLMKNAADRYQSAQHLLEAVQSAGRSDGASYAPQPPAPHYAPQPPAPRVSPAQGLISCDPYLPPPSASTPPPSASSGSTPMLGRGWLMAGGVAAVLLCLFVLGGVGLWYALSGPTVENVNASALTSNTAGSVKPGNKTVKVEMSDGPAEIWQGDKLLGVGEASVTANVGDWIELKIRRNGQERVERFQMTENRKTWTLTFKK